MEDSENLEAVSDEEDNPLKHTGHLVFEGGVKHGVISEESTSKDSPLKIGEAQSSLKKRDRGSK